MRITKPNAPAPIHPSRLSASPARCALCGRTDTRTIASAGYMNTALDARICRDWLECSDRR